MLNKPPTATFDLALAAPMRAGARPAVFFAEAEGNAAVGLRGLGRGFSPCTHGPNA